MQVVNAFDLTYADVKNFLGDPNPKSLPMMTVVKDSDGNKKINWVKDPKKRFYISKPEYWDPELKPLSMPLSQVQEFSGSTNGLHNSILNALEKMGDRNIRNWWKGQTADKGNFRNAVKRLETDGRIFESDGNISDQFIMDFDKKYPRAENSIGVTRAAFDIEVDAVAGGVTGFPEPSKAEAPVNIITIYFHEWNECHTFITEIPTEDYMEVRKNDFQKIREAVLDRYKDRDGFKFFINEYKQGEAGELQMITDFFSLVNSEGYRPDYVFGWNVIFDMETLQNRIIKLGGDPADIMSADESEIKFEKIIPDTRNHEIANKNHTMEVASYSIYIDLMNVYASFTKPAGVKESYSLDYIGELETGQRKDEYAGSITNLAYRDYFIFAMYNIQDVILVDDIDEQTGQIDLLDMVAFLSNTRPSVSLKKTVSLRNYVQYFYNNGDPENPLVMGNNLSSTYPELDQKPKGAFVLSPEMMSKTGLPDATGNQSNRIFNWLADMDFSQMYPSTIAQRNISPDTVEFSLSYYDGDENKTEEFMDDWSSANGYKYATKYYNLPTIDDIISRYEADQA